MATSTTAILPGHWRTYNISTDEVVTMSDTIVLVETPTGNYYRALLIRGEEYTSIYVAAMAYVKFKHDDLPEFIKFKLALIGAEPSPKTYSLTAGINNNVGWHVAIDYRRDKSHYCIVMSDEEMNSLRMRPIIWRDQRVTIEELYQRDQGVAKAYSNQQAYQQQMSQNAMQNQMYQQAMQHQQQAKVYAQGYGNNVGGIVPTTIATSTTAAPSWFTPFPPII